MSQNSSKLYKHRESLSTKEWNFIEFKDHDSYTKDKAFSD
jgi:hypothetical protein